MEIMSLILSYFGNYNTLQWNHVTMHLHYFTDLDVDTLEGLASECNFPWLLSNVIDMLHGLHDEGSEGERKLLGNAKEYLIKEWQGVKVGRCGELR